jgi:DNA-directed RNA polymerase subunit M/transcription elongation factor TFIIS
MCENNSCVFKAIRWWKIMVQGDIVIKTFYECTNCGNSYVE